MPRYDPETFRLPRSAMHAAHAFHEETGCLPSETELATAAKVAGIHPDQTEEWVRAVLRHIRVLDAE